LHIQLTGGKAAGSGKLFSLSARTTAATNSITQPSLIVPVESGLHDLASHTVPGYTIQVLELKAQ